MRLCPCLGNKCYHLSHYTAFQLVLICLRILLLGCHLRLPQSDLSRMLCFVSELCQRCDSLPVRPALWPNDPANVAVQLQWLEDSWVHVCESSGVLGVQIGKVEQQKLYGQVQRGWTMFVGQGGGVQRLGSAQLQRLEFVWLWCRMSQVLSNSPGITPMTPWPHTHRGGPGFTHLTHICRSLPLHHGGLAGSLFWGGD
jgi:hypothetical protein